MKYIEKLFKNTSDRRIIDAINLRNIRNVYTFSIIACILDSITLMLFIITDRGDPRFLKTVISVGSCVVACALVIFLSKSIILRYKKEGAVSNVKANLLVTFFYIVMSVWGIVVDISHYSAGEQMLTFYIVQFSFLCFVVMRPKTGSILIALSFSALYLNLYIADGAVNMQPQNYLIFSIIAVLGNAIQHMMLEDSERYKADMLELNQILRQEASVDDLTKLKNRKALRSDFDKHIGKSIYAIMADVDNFKNYNDTCGHVAGDNVLRLVASAIMEAFGSDNAYRYGGDEFLIITEDCTEEEFRDKTEKWKEKIKAVQKECAGPPVSCSFGYAHCRIDSPNDLREAIQAADSKLYEVKKARSR